MGRGGARRRLLAAAVAAALAATTAGCGGSGTDGGPPAAGGTTTSAAGPSSGPIAAITTTTTGPAGFDEDAVMARTYTVGECVTWASSDSLTPPATVDCSDPHRMQITGRTEAPRLGHYPSADEWTVFVTTTCPQMAQQLIGAPLDPYGRFSVSAFFASAEGWARGDRTVWCGLGHNTGAASVGAGTLTEDVRGADQSYHFAVGECIAFPPALDDVAAVPCDQPHQKEITGEISYPEAGGPPTGGVADERCDGLALDYLGRRPPEPWLVGSESLPIESWTAGRRTSHCFLGQWEADGITMKVVTGSLRGQS
jgi:Septum formation